MLFFRLFLHKKKTPIYKQNVNGLQIQKIFSVVQPITRGLEPCPCTPQQAGLLAHRSTHNACLPGLPVTSAACAP